MHILAFTHYFPPEVNAPALRLSEHAREWVRLGHRVTIVTGPPNHPDGKVYPGFRNRLFHREEIDGVEVIRVWTYLAANQGFLPRIANYVSFMLSAGLQGWRLPRADVVLSTSPQFFCGLTGWLFARRHRPWVLEIRDLWPESIIAVGAMKRGFVIRALERIERAAYRRADLVVSVTDGFIAHIAPHRSGKPIEVIKNGADLSRFTDPDLAAAMAFRIEYGLTGKFVASYVGTHGMAHGLDALLDAAALLRDRSDITILMVGGGSERARLVAERDGLQLNNVVMVDQLPSAMMPVVLAASDISLVLLKRLDTFRTVIPSKMFETMASRRPMILGVEGEARAILDASDAGIAITPEDAAELAKAIIYLADHPDEVARHAATGHAYVAAEFDRSILAGRMAAACERLLAR
ncbi:glycosyltransferase family 4 protein [Sphingomonas asaccharolytica]|uniref:glycosyltransferase family 4 protein n=1 Tax=Sphingomonas asaccharolytica TaxID=40681 RepID=UPI00082D6CA2|nr:glycosyltransferase family 4 protein [Sphingomonas asaccharolytica]